MERNFNRWLSQYKASQVGEDESEMPELIKWLECRIPQQQAFTLLHGDYRYNSMQRTQQIIIYILTLPLE
jgi:aminoglycoside phosphotransferase (APT) family kinase protein